jgi:hypothetical protein
MTITQFYHKLECFGLIYSKTIKKILELLSLIIFTIILFMEIKYKLKCLTQSLSNSSPYSLYISLILFFLHKSVLNYFSKIILILNTFNSTFPISLTTLSILQLLINYCLLLIQHTF